MTYFRIFVLGALLLTVDFAPASPFVGPTKLEAIKILKSQNVKDSLPITLGKDSPKAVINFVGGVWTFKKLVTNKSIQKSIAEKQTKAGYYMPEHDFAALEPGETIASDKDRKTFIKKLETVAWDF